MREKFNGVPHLLGVFIILNLLIAVSVMAENISKKVQIKRKSDFSGNKIQKNLSPEIMEDTDYNIEENFYPDLRDDDDNAAKLDDKLQFDNNNSRAAGSNSSWTTTKTTTSFDGYHSSRHDFFDFNDFQCFNETERAMYSKVIYNPSYKEPVNIRVSKRVSHQISSRIFGIFIHEMLKHQHVSLVPERIIENETDVTKLFLRLGDLTSYENLVDVEVWIPPNFHIFPYTISDCGILTLPGRYGWYTEESFTDKTNIFGEDLNYNTFLYPHNSTYYRSYVVEHQMLDELEKMFGFQKVLKFEECQNYECATIFAPDYSETMFLSQQISDLKFYLQIIWIEHERYEGLITYLHNKYQSRKLRDQGKRYLFLSWTPSIIIDGKINYTSITLPRCEEFPTAKFGQTCKYEMTPILKFCDKRFQNLRYAQSALKYFEVKLPVLKELMAQTKLARANNPHLADNDIYNRIACNYLREQTDEFADWTVGEKNHLIIGGIFPLTGAGKSYGNLLAVTRNALATINDNSTVLPNFQLSILYNDGECKADMVMKAFVHYIYVPLMLIGILGPACSETVEPIAGMSKHARLSVISYSAEGALFTDRETYPYFFRTIGSNRQYQHVYIDLFKHFKWRQMAALTEDGQKYTEYISHMETALKKEGMDLILNKKFPKDVSKFQVNRLLQEYKNKKAKIILADIYNDNAKLIMCEAFQLEMTAKHGYVWFLPVWVSKTWKHNNASSHDVQNLTCTQEQLYEAINGHFSLTHASFAPDDSVMIANTTVREWKQSYLRTSGEQSLSDYAGFVYDAIWAYALAADQLIREDITAIYDIKSPESIKHFNKILWRTDFNGLSGRIRFGEGGSRIDNVDILQWIDGKFNVVGQFVPVIDEANWKISGGKLSLNESNIVWLNGERPKDGAYECSMSALAEFFQTNCDNVNYIVIILSLVIALCILSTGSFIFWKYRYHAKLKQSAKVMKNFGIDLLSPNANTPNTLDKWEVPKDKIVINRRLGKGAFGFVYGGEAQLQDDCWTAVAVKTLKAGASREDRLDFLCEAEAMKRFDHKNIIKLLGVCLQSEPIYTIMEYMLYGDLKTFLLARRNLVNEKLTDDSDIHPKRLSMYALDVARGLSYLANEKYVHRDVACRNCLVNAQRVVKLGDFGMARPTFESDYYRFNRKGMLPVRWMAPESLGLGLFTPASDVWSFAVLLYEIITFGSFPYQGLTNNETLEEIKKGKTISIPQGVKPHLEGLMKACWSLDYKKRPSASEIVEYISSYPRLLTPCLDVPVSSVQITENDSDQLELLPGLRKRHTAQPNIDILSQSPSFSTNPPNNSFNENQNNSSSISDNSNPLLKPCSIVIHNNDDKIIENVIGNSIEENNLNGYSVMSPLLKMEPEITSSNSSLKRYVPMYNIGKKPKIQNNNNNNNSNNNSPVNGKYSIDSNKLNNNKLFKNDMELFEMKS